MISGAFNSLNTRPKPKPLKFRALPKRLQGQDPARKISDLFTNPTPHPQWQPPTPAPNYDPIPGESPFSPRNVARNEKRHRVEQRQGLGLPAVSPGEVDPNQTAAVRNRKNPQHYASGFDYLRRKLPRDMFEANADRLRSALIAENGGEYTGDLETLDGKKVTGSGRTYQNAIQAAKAIEQMIRAGRWADVDTVAQTFRERRDAQSRNRQLQEQMRQEARYGKILANPYASAYLDETQKRALAAGNEDLTGVELTSAGFNELSADTGRVVKDWAGGDRADELRKGLGNSPWERLADMGLAAYSGTTNLIGGTFGMLPDVAGDLVNLASPSTPLLDTVGAAANVVGKGAAIAATAGGVGAGAAMMRAGRPVAGATKIVAELAAGDPGDLIRAGATRGGTQTPLRPVFDREGFTQGIRAGEGVTEVGEGAIRIGDLPSRDPAPRPAPQGGRVMSEIQDIEGNRATRETMAARDIGYDPDLQFKREEIDPKTGAARWVEETEVDPAQLGELTVWERADGTRFVMDGHHRRRLAQRADLDNVAVLVYRESEGVTKQQARYLGAMRNIRDGKGSAMDIAGVLREGGLVTLDDLKAKGVNLRFKNSKIGISLSTLDDEGWSMVRNRAVTEEAAAGIADSIPATDPGRRMIALRKAARAEAIRSYDAGYELGEAVRTRPVVQKPSGSGSGKRLFEDVEDDVPLERVAELTVAAKQELASEIRNLRKTAKGKRAGSTVVDEDAQMAEAQAQAEAQEVLRTIGNIIDEEAYKYDANPTREQRAQSVERIVAEARQAAEARRVRLGLAGGRPGTPARPAQRGAADVVPGRGVAGDPTPQPPARVAPAPEPPRPVEDVAPAVEPVPDLPPPSTLDVEGSERRLGFDDIRARSRERALALPHKDKIGFGTGQRRPSTPDEMRLHAINLRMKADRLIESARKRLNSIPSWAETGASKYGQTFGKQIDKANAGVENAYAKAKELREAAVKWDRRADLDDPDMIELRQRQRAIQEEAREKIKKRDSEERNSAPIINDPSGAPMTSAEWAKIPKDYKGISVQDGVRVRTTIINGALQEVYLTDKPLKPKGNTPRAEAPRSVEDVPRAVTDKKPWEMTRAEWGDAWELTRPNAQGTGGDGRRIGGMGQATSEKGLKARIQAVQRERERLSFYVDDPMEPGQRAWASHFDVVKKALAQGEPVPAHVLADYPTLKSSTPDTPRAEAPRPVEGGDGIDAVYAGQRDNFSPERIDQFVAAAKKVHEAGNDWHKMLQDLGATRNEITMVGLKGQLPAPKKIEKEVSGGLFGEDPDASPSLGLDLAVTVPKSKGPSRPSAPGIKEFEQRLNDLMALARGEGVQVYTKGKPKPPKGAMGAHYQKTKFGTKGEIRANPYDARTLAEVIAHEVAHSIDNLMGDKAGTRKAIKMFAGDSYYTVKAELEAVTRALEGDAVVDSKPKYFLNDAELWARFLQAKMFHPHLIELHAPLSDVKLNELAASNEYVSQYLNIASGKVLNMDPGFQFLADRRQTYQKKLGRYLGTKAYNNEIVFNARRAKAIEETNQMMRRKLAKVKDSPRDLFRAAEGIKTNVGGKIEFGTMDRVTIDPASPGADAKIEKLMERGYDIVDDKPTGVVLEKERYSAAEAEANYNKLSPEGKALVDDYTKDVTEAADHFNRNKLKADFNLQGDQEGYVHRFWEDKGITKWRKLFMKQRVAASQRKRMGAGGFVEDLGKATAKNIIDTKIVKEWNDFIHKQIATVANPILDPNEVREGFVPIMGRPDIGYTEVLGGYVQPRSAGRLYEVPTEVWDLYKTGGKASTDIRAFKEAVLAVNRYWSTNILLHPGTLGMNVYGGAIQLGTKFIDDLILDLFGSGGLRNRTTANALGLLETMTPKGYRKAPAWVYGGDDSHWVATFEGDVRDPFWEKVSLPHRKIEEFFKKAIINMESRKATGVDLDDPEFLAAVNQVIDVYAFDYQNVMPWMTKARKNGWLQIAKPFVTYPYKYTKMLTYLAGSAFDPRLPMETRVARSMSLALHVGAWMAAQQISNRRASSNEQSEPTEGIVRKRMDMPHWRNQGLQQGQGMFLGESGDDDVYLNMSRYPIANVAMFMNALAAGDWDSAKKVIKEQIGGLGPVAQVGMAVAGYRGEYDQYKETGPLMGDILGSYVPLSRMSSDIKQALDPVKRKNETFADAFLSKTPIPHERPKKMVDYGGDGTGQKSEVRNPQMQAALRMLGVSVQPVDRPLRMRAMKRAVIPPAKK